MVIIKEKYICVANSYSVDHFILLRESLSLWTFELIRLESNVSGGTFNSNDHLIRTLRKETQNGSVNPTENQDRFKIWVQIACEIRWEIDTSY